MDSEELRRVKELELELHRLSKHPRASSYANHRTRVAKRALQILQLTAQVFDWDR